MSNSVEQQFGELSLSQDEHDQMYDQDDQQDSIVDVKCMATLKGSIDGSPILTSISLFPALRLENETSII
ncbi:unnamed protein product [Pieris macdunnoughi]|uniref:Uncharacterized protein n=1 Tax=Pieris macdunnoughi TaxID=345717 RepID=A0A821LKH4_9NEOP|nr:unnamed protein product [Pieris macdunnoughi]